MVKDTYTYINGAFLPKQEARVSVEERAFRFGDGCFETIGVKDGVPYRFESHRERLSRGLQALSIAYDTSALAHTCRELLIRNTLSEGTLRLSVSRGVGSQGYMPLTTCTPTVVIETLPTAATVLPEAFTLYVSSYEKASPRAYPTAYKTMQGLNSTLAKTEAAEHGCHEALLLSSSGTIAETSSSNIFWIKNGTLFTPSLATGALAGVTREAVISLSPYEVTEGEYSLEALQQAECVFLTNSNLGIMPVSELRPQSWCWKMNAQIEHLQQRLDNDKQQYVNKHRSFWH